MGFFRKTEQQQEAIPQEIGDLRDKAAGARLPEEVAAVCFKELDRLQRTDPSLGEYAIGFNYVDNLLSLPWNRYTQDNLDLDRAEHILKGKHFGLQHVKERILEFLAVRTMRILSKARILVVDDEETARRNMVRALEKEGYEVAVAGNGAEALEMASA